MRNDITNTIYFYILFRQSSFVMLKRYTSQGLGVEDLIAHRDVIPAGSGRVKGVGIFRFYTQNETLISI